MAHVLGELGIAEGRAPFEVWNKADLLGGERGDALRAEAAGRDDVVLVSALTGAGDRSPSGGDVHASHSGAADANCHTGCQ